MSTASTAWFVYIGPVAVFDAHSSSPPGCTRPMYMGRASVSIASTAWHVYTGPVAVLGVYSSFVVGPRVYDPNVNKPDERAQGLRKRHEHGVARVHRACVELGIVPEQLTVLQQFHRAVDLVRTRDRGRPGRDYPL